MSERRIVKQEKECLCPDCGLATRDAMPVVCILRRTSRLVPYCPACKAPFEPKED